MSAPSIPNLLSLQARGGRGRGRSRGASRGSGLEHGGRGRGRGGFDVSSDTSFEAPGDRGQDDAAVQGTDTDAAVSRLSAVDLGYLDDPYARYFVSAAQGPPARRFPIINRGTYTRTAAIDKLVRLFLAGADGKDQERGIVKQIVSLGAGTDTRPFRLFSQRDRPTLIYHEIDFPVISAKKLKTVEAVPLLASILTDRSTEDSGSWSSKPWNGEYFCHGLDIRRLSAPATKILPGLRTDVSTLVLSECCLCYLPQKESDDVLKYFWDRIGEMSFVIYEPVHMGDPFSDTMVSNLAARNIHMPCLDHPRHHDTLFVRLTQMGFDDKDYLNMDEAWARWVTAEERERVDRLEGLDEVEEWRLLAKHYVVIWSHKGRGFEGWNTIGL